VFKTTMAITPAPAKFAPLLFAGDWRAGLQTALELGYDAVELSLRDPQAQVVKDLGSAIAGSGLTVSAIATGQSYYNDDLSPTSADASVQGRLFERMQGFVEFAAPYGASVIIGGVRGTFEGDERARTEQRKRAVEAIRGYARCAESAGVSLLVEPINRYETNFVNTVAEALALIDEVGADNLLVLADTFHMNIEEASMPGAFESAGDRLGYVHFPDSNRLAAGQGHVDFRDLVNTLRTMGYDGYLGAEILPLPDSRTAARQAIDFFRSL
jgi:sugar phosphate isomerase/epimerase